ncbi:hypothetical protein [Caldivirga sp. UBA161]|uniref:hypothetical protein n=1 Tax=Caldivirga sp. UBA161 TaxID=1915569 RepID=UPI0025C47365|nr:hypothetical protein [Caldivirga sp. UBA161]
MRYWNEVTYEGRRFFSGAGVTWLAHAGSTMRSAGQCLSVNTQQLLNLNNEARESFLTLLKANKSRVPIKPHHASLSAVKAPKARQ